MTRILFVKEIFSEASWDIPEETAIKKVKSAINLLIIISNLKINFISCQTI
jgi:hypothetical protein